MDYRSLVSSGQRALKASTLHLPIIRKLWVYIPDLKHTICSAVDVVHGGANMKGWTEKMSDDELEIVRNAGGVLLQREIPDSINIQVAKAVKRAVVPVILDMGGMDTPIPNELLDSVDVLS
ncbi:hypothetical protein Bca4012_048898 [Brassica carinata]